MERGVNVDLPERFQAQVDEHQIDCSLLNYYECTQKRAIDSNYQFVFPICEVMGETLGSAKLI